MILGFGGGSPFPFPLRSNNDHYNNQFPDEGPTSAHFFCSVSSKMKGAFNRQGCHLRKCNFFQRLNDVTLAACTSCFCFFDGKSSGEEIGKEVVSPQATFIKKFFRQGSWTNALFATNVLSLFIAVLAVAGLDIEWYRGTYCYILTVAILLPSDEATLTDINRT